MRFIQIIILALILSGCQKLLYHEIIVENSTDHQVLIEAFYEAEEVENIAIEAKSSYNRSEYRAKGDGFPYLFKTTLIDSVNIIFDNEQILIQSCENSILLFCPEISRNVMQVLREYKEYKEQETGKNSYYYTYTITEEDYNNAVPLEE